ncbi:MAG: sigma-70 family RNA polymerase sigma factor [Candidatus Sericytochromatia bacterium]
MDKEPLPADVKATNQEKNLAERFETHRKHLRAVAFRLLGSLSEAEDAVQETWLRLSRSDASKLTNLGGWLTTVIARICLDMLRWRTSRREVPLEDPQPAAGPESGFDPAQEVLLADAVGVALLVVLERLSPAERIAFVLHDLFELPFDEISVIVGRSSAATRKLASRARLRVRLGESMPEPEQTQKWKVVDAFLAASRSGDLEALLVVLDPEVIFRADPKAMQMGMHLGVGSEIRGSQSVAGFYRDVAEFYKKHSQQRHRAGRGGGLVPAWVDGVPGLVAQLNGSLVAVVKLSLADDKITCIENIADPRQMEHFELKLRDAV